MKTNPHSPTAGFSLVEVCMAIGVVAFAFIGLVGLLPAGMDTFRNSMNQSIGSQIIQRVITEAQQTNFKELVGGEPPMKGYYEFTKIRYFDEEGNELQESQKSRSIYHVHVVAQGTPLFPNDSNGNTIEMDDLANVTVQVAVNPGQKTIATDATTFLWKTETDPKKFVPIRNQSVIVANHD